MADSKRRRKKEPGKAPAYQWFPKDARTDEAFLLMTHEERGVYRDLLDHQWVHGSIPNDTDLAAIAACAAGNTGADRLAIIWPKIRPCFTRTEDGRLRNLRLERQRSELHVYTEGQRKKGIKGAAKRWKGKRIAADGRGYAQAEAKNNSAPAPASAPASRKTEDLFQNEATPTQVDALIGLWNTDREPGPKIMRTVPAPTRKKIAKALGQMPNLADWKTIIQWLNRQDWANGQTDRKWWADLPWLCQPGKPHDTLERARLDTRRVPMAPGVVVGRDAKTGRTGVAADKYDGLTHKAHAADDVNEA